MTVSVSQQLIEFLLSCAVGVLLGFLIDLFRIFRAAVHCRAAAVFFQDLLCFILCALITFLFILTENSGRVRLFLLEGELLGAVVYALTLGVLVMRAARSAIRRSKNAARAVGAKVTPKVRALDARARSGLRAHAQKTGRFVKKESDLLKIRLQAGQKVLYNHLCITRGRHSAEKKLEAKKASKKKASKKKHPTKKVTKKKR